MKKQLKFLLFAILMLTLVMMTMICVSAAADGDTEATEGFNVNDYSFKVEDKDGITVGYYITLGSSVKGTDGGAWSAVPEGGKLLLLKDVNYGTNTTFYLLNSKSFTFDGQGYTLTYLAAEMFHSAGSTTVLENVINISNLTIDAKGKCPLVFNGYGTTYNVADVTLKSTGSYGVVIRGSLNTVNFNGENNSVSSSSNAILADKVATFVNIYGGSFTNSGKQATIHTTSANTVADGFDFVLNIYGGTFTHSNTTTSGYYNGVIAAYNSAGQKQINISGGTFTSAGRFVIVKLASDTLDLNISDGTFVSTHASAEAIIRYFNNATEVAPVTMGDKTITSSIDITGGTFNMTNTGMPIIYSYTNTAIGTAACPVEINVSNATITKANRLIVARTGGYFNIALSNIQGAKCGTSYGYVEIEEEANATVTVEDCELTAAGYLVNAKGTGTVTASVDGGSYTLSAGIMTSASVAATADIVSGEFTVSTVDALSATNVTLAIKNADAESNALDVNFRLSTVTAETDFTQMTALYNAATNKANVTVTAGYTHTVTADLENVDGPAALKTAANLTNVPDYVKLDISLIVQEGATVTFTGGIYTTENSYFVRVDNGKVVATGITLNSLYRAFYITQADASVEVELNNCVITVADGHVLQGNTGSNTIAKLYLTINGGTYVAKGSKNVFSFGATTDAKVTITAGDFDLTTNIGYVASAGTYTITGGTFKTGSACFNVVAAATFNLSGATFNSGSSLFSFDADAAACTVTVDDCVVNAKSHVIYSASDAAHDITVKNSVLIQTVENAMEVIKAAGATLKMTDSIVLANLATTILNDTLDVDAYAPTVKFGGVVYYAYMTTEGAEINKAGAEIYMGLDKDGNLVDGIRFTSELSADVIALVKAAVDAKKSVSYGMIIAPADYVVAAGTFTKAALDEAFGSTDGVLASGKNTYVDVPAVNSKRDANNDGVCESFSAMLINIKETNYTRAFAAVGYVVIDGEIIYSAYNTSDNARSAQYVATALLESGYYEGEDDMIAILNKYAGVAAE